MGHFAGCAVCAVLHRLDWPVRLIKQKIQTYAKQTETLPTMAAGRVSVFRDRETVFHTLQSIDNGKYPAW